MAKTDYEEHFVEPYGVIDDLVEALKKTHPDAAEEIEDHWTDAKNALDEMQEIFYQVDKGSYDEDDDDE